MDDWRETRAAAVINEARPANDVNVCQLVFVSEMDILSTCFNLRTIYLVGGLQ